MDKELLRLYPDVFWWRTVRPAQRVARCADVLRLQSDSLVDILLQRHCRCRCRPPSSRQVLASDSFGRSQHTHGLYTHDSDVLPRYGCIVPAPPRSDESGHGSHRVLLCAQPCLLLQVEAVCHTRRVYSSLRICAAHTGRRFRLRVGAEQLDCHHDLPAHAVHVVCQATRRRAAHERDRRGTAQEYRALQSHLHQPGHHHHRFRDTRMLHHVLRVA